MNNLSTNQLRHIATLKPDTSREVPRELLDYKLLCRQNTGISVLDSGEADKRFWQQPMPSDHYISWNAADGPAQFNTYAVLGDCWAIDQELTTEYWQKFEVIGKYLDKFLGAATDVQVLDALLKAKGYTNHYGDNTYNSDLYSYTQGINYNYYNHDTLSMLVTVQIHNGADVRGGYSTPVIAIPDDIGGPHPYQPEYRAYRGFSASGEELASEGLPEWCDGEYMYEALKEDVDLLDVPINGTAFPAIRKSDGALLFIHASYEEPPSLFRAAEDAIKDQHFAGDLSHPKRKRWMREVEQYLQIRYNNQDTQARSLLADLLALQLEGKEPR